MTINGALCFVGNEVVRCKNIPQEAVMTVVEDAKNKNYGLIVVGERDVAVLDPHGEVDKIFRGEIAVENLNLARAFGCDSPTENPSVDTVLPRRIRA